jgi:hypothetical protein
MSQKGALRAVQAAERRFQREAQKRRRELERQAKEMAKLSALEQARLEVETYENQLDLLLSIHKEPCETWDWVGLASALVPPPPCRYFRNEGCARQLALVAHPDGRAAARSLIEDGRALDDQYHREALTVYAGELTEIEKLRNLAMRVLAGENMAFLEAFAEFNPVAEFSSVGSLKQFAVESEELIECVFKVNANEVIPKEVKTLTASGKVSIKLMPKARFHEIYQDYVCGCMFRMAREVFAMLPVEMLLVTALAEVADSRTGQYSEKAVLSVALPRASVARLNFDEIAPADAIDKFVHRGNFTASRKAGAFLAIVPLTPSDLRASSPQQMAFSDLVANIRELRGEIGPAAQTSRSGSDQSAV